MIALASSGRHKAVRIDVRGLPRPKGSMIYGYRQSSRGVKAWEMIIRSIARYAFQTTIAGPVELALRFRFQPPKCSTLGYPGKNVGDVDKLTRAVLDGLTGVAYVDDSQVVRVDVSKDFSAKPEGVEIWVQATEPNWTIGGTCRRRTNGEKT